MQRVCAPSLWTCGLLINRHIFYKCCHKQCSLRIDGGTARKRGASGWGETAFFWHIREDLMVAIKEQMHWPWMQDLKDIFMGLLVYARNQTKSPDGNSVSKWPNGRGLSDLLARFLKKSQGTMLKVPLYSSHRSWLKDTSQINTSTGQSNVRVSISLLSCTEMPRLYWSERTR